MKKLLIALLAVLICLSLVACGDPADTTGADDITGGVDGTGSVTPGTDGPGVDTEEPEDTETLSVGVDDATEFGPINQ